MGTEVRKWEVRILDDLHPLELKGVADFLNEQYPGVYFPECSPEIFIWKLGSSNPAGRGFMTVAISNNKVVGVFTLTKKKLTINGELVYAGEIGDAFTHPEYRRNTLCITPNEQLELLDDYYSKSIFGRLVAETLNRAKENGVEFVYGTPNDVARPSYLKRLGFNECSNTDIYHKYYLTKKFNKLPTFSLLINFLSRFQERYCSIYVTLKLGRNAIQPTSFSDLSNDPFFSIKFPEQKEDELQIDFSKEYLQHRYVDNPTTKYVFFKIVVKDKTMGVVIASEVVRASGMKTMVLSDWKLCDMNLERSLGVIFGSIRSFANDSQTISLWQKSKTSRIKFLTSGFFSTKPMSIVGKSLVEAGPSKGYTFNDFHFGWSDNG